MVSLLLSSTNLSPVFLFRRLIAHSPSSVPEPSDIQGGFNYSVTNAWSYQYKS